jgi:hypothetical protein
MGGIDLSLFDIFEYILSFLQGSWAVLIRKVGKVISATCFNAIDLETYRNRHINIYLPETGCLIKSNIQ